MFFFTSNIVEVLPFEGIVVGKRGEKRKKFASRTIFVPAELVPSVTPREDSIMSDHHVDTV